MLILRGSSMQIIIVLLVSLISVAIIMDLQPYVHGQDNRVAIIAQWTITLTLIVALIIRVNAVDPTTDADALGAVLITINVTVLALGMASTVIQSGNSISDDESVSSESNEDQRDEIEGNQKSNEVGVEYSSNGDERLEGIEMNPIQNNDDTKPSIDYADGAFVQRMMREAEHDSDDEFS